MNTTFPANRKTGRYCSGSKTSDDEIKRCINFVRASLVRPNAIVVKLLMFVGRLS